MFAGQWEPLQAAETSMQVSILVQLSHSSGSDGSITTCHSVSHSFW
jgi:hypothetical protein